MNWDEIRKQITIYEEEHRKELSKERADLVNRLLQVAGSLKWTCDISANKKIFISKLEEKIIQFTICERKERNKIRNRQAILQIGENVYKSTEYDEGVLLNLITTSKPSVNLSKNITVVNNPQNSKKNREKKNRIQSDDVKTTDIHDKKINLNEKEIKDTPSTDDINRIWESILRQAKADTLDRKILWEVYFPNDNLIFYVGRRNAKKKREIVIVKRRTKNGTITELYKSNTGFYIPYSSFKSLENIVVGVKCKIHNGSYSPKGKLVNSLEDIIKYSKVNEDKNIENDTQNQKEKSSKHNNNNNKNNTERKKNNATTVGIKDFVIRRTVFKCMHKSHHLKNVDAEVIVRSRIGTERLIPFSAGYCEECNLYFVLESTYEYLRKYGIPNCRVSDEKTYMNTISSNGMILAQESILMQYGYTVSQEFDLSEMTRRKILANLIDNKIMTKSEIISYLDFFISQHTSSKYQMAVGKWELDRDFVRDYNIGKYTKYGVGGIRR